MSFWNLNDGTKAESVTEFESGGGDLEPIPNGTGCIAAIEEAKWDEYKDDEYISLKWRVMKPADYANRVIYQKVKVMGTAQCKDRLATADKAKRMLAAIDTNAGGKLMQVQGKPQDTDLMVALVGKQMAIKAMLWKIKDESTGDIKQGNWIGAVAPYKGKPIAQAPKPVPVADPAPVADDFDEDNIPF